LRTSALRVKNSGGLVDDETVTVTGDGTYATPTGYTVTPTAAGDYDWHVVYIGDNDSLAEDDATVFVVSP
jgi:hypothetical protein